MATYYVATTGSNGNPGSEGSPWLTLAYACTQISANDIVIVEDGTYGVAGGAAYPITVSDNNVTLKARNQWGAILDGEYTEENCIVAGSGVTGVTIDGFWIKRFEEQSGSSDASGIQLYNGGASWVIKNCRISNIGDNSTSASTGGQNCIFIYRDNVIVEDCFFHDTGRTNVGGDNHDQGIYLDGALGTDGCIIRRNFFRNINSGYGIQIYPGTISNADIYENTFVYGNNARDQASIVWQGAVFTNVDIYDNTFWDDSAPASTYPFYIYNTSGSTFSGCTCTGNRTTGAQLANQAWPAGVTVSGNTVNSGDSKPADPTAAAGAVVKAGKGIIGRL